MPLLSRFPLREDEALYAYWALHFLYEDSLFLTVWPDKPPIFLWLLAVVLGATTPENVLQAEALARWLNVAASVAMIPVTASVARRWWGPRAGVAAATFLALNPFAIAFAPTVYTDPVLVLAGTLALACVVHTRWFWAGVWLSVAVMTKQQGLLYVPLILGLWLHAGAHAGYGVAALRAGGRLLAGAAVVLMPILYWDSLRWAVAPSPWDLALRTYSPIGLAPTPDWAERLQGWADVGWYLAAAWWVWVVLALGAAARLYPSPALPKLGRGLSYHVASGARISAPILVAVWSVGFVAVHVLTTIQIWDRYWLPLVPVLALAAGWIAAGVRHGGINLGRHGGLPLLAALVVVLAQPAWHASQGRYPVGGDHGDYAGLHEAMAWLDTHAGPRYVLYHQVLGWHYPFYFFAEMRGGRVEPRWFPGPPGLADNAAKTPFPPKYLIVPDWAPQSHAALHLATRGMTWTTRAQAGKMRVVEIVRMPPPACDWCLCRPAFHAPAAPWRLAQPVQPGMMSRP